MTRVKCCGLRRMADIEAANELKPDYIGFIFVSDRKRYIDPDKALELRAKLDSDIKVVGVFINEEPTIVANIAMRGIMDVIQLHGTEDDDYIERLRRLTDKPIIKAFRIDTEDDIKRAALSTADYVLLDNGIGGTGSTFDWSHIKNIKRPYFLAGGLDANNITDAITELHPYAVDVSSGIETDGYKDREKMARFIELVRKEVAHD